eukprot:12739388-Alexandrium_andersonii.AAC.1
MGGRGPSSPNGPTGPLRGSESAQIRSPRTADPSAGDAALRAQICNTQPPMFCRFRDAERAVWPVGRAGTETSHGGLGATSPTSTGGFGGPVGVPSCDRL